jgi:hypothetical protein
LAEPKPIAWIGFPENEPKPPYDLVYDNTTQLPGYRYTPIWAPQDHPCAVRDRKGAKVQ